MCGSPCRLGCRASRLGFPPTKWVWSLKELHRCSLRPHKITLSAVVENGEYGHLGKSLCVGPRDRFVNPVNYRKTLILQEVPDEATHANT